MVEFDFKTLEHRLRELAFLNSGVRIILRDLRHPEPVEVELHYEGGLEAFVRYLDKTKSALIADPIYFTQDKDGITVEAGAVVERQLPRERACASPTTSRSATAAPIWPVSAGR